MNFSSQRLASRAGTVIAKQPSDSKEGHADYRLIPRACIAPSNELFAQCQLAAWRILAVSKSSTAKKEKRNERHADFNLNKPYVTTPVYTHIGRNRCLFFFHRFALAGRSQYFIALSLTVLARLLVNFQAIFFAGSINFPSRGKSRYQNVCKNVESQTRQMIKI